MEKDEKGIVMIRVGDKTSWQMSHDYCTTKVSCVEVFHPGEITYLSGDKEQIIKQFMELLGVSFYSAYVDEGLVIASCMGNEIISSIKKEPEWAGIGSGIM